jgi:transcriptional regulator with XRE-family HTH domain
LARCVFHSASDVSDLGIDISAVISAGQLRAARALLGLDQRALAHAAGLSVATIQRMESSEGVVRGNVDSLMKLVAALEQAGVELLAEGRESVSGGRGVRLKRTETGP